jgi:NADH:ubiquinone oxidoreductase subunit F (NADH-binding)/(2Fe-2S) ferredoxin
MGITMITCADDLVKAKEQGNKRLFSSRVRVNVGTSTCCMAKGAELTYNALAYGIKSAGIDAELVKVGCNGMCWAEPVVAVLQPGKPQVIYGNVTEKEVPRLLEAIAKNQVLSDMAVARIDAEDHIMVGRIDYATDASSLADHPVATIETTDFAQAQHRVILRNAGAIDPENIDEYIARGGYSALSKALGMKPEQIVQEVTGSGLRGRGGAGFPAGVKWRMCREAAGDVKYLICNVSEGEPGIGMHRSFLESDPHAVVEGLIIGGFAIGAQTAYIYVRDNYRLALQRITKAVNDAREAGLLGGNILKSGFAMDIIVKEGGGRYVCGEETALIACIEGKIGEPRQRPPFPTNSGLFGKPTCINNVETWANIPVIIEKGATWYSAIGSAKSKGTKVLSLAGNIARPGMIEVDMGTKISRIIDGIGGGIPGGKTLKGIQPGGPSGGILPASMAKLTIDYDDLANAGSMLGSGGMVIMDDSNDMVKLARYFTDFFVNESCGKCVPCREGVCRVRDMLDELIAGRADTAILDAFSAVAAPITKACACALGKTSMVPVTSTMQHFRKDYESYLQQS